MRVLALTDHDTLEGLEEARSAATALGMQLVNGVELSCTWGGATIHVLGYGFDVNAAPLVEAIAKLHDGRWLRSEEISRKLALKGMPGALEGARAIQQELGDSGNAPRGTTVAHSQIWTSDPKSPAVRLIASRLGPESSVVAGEQLGLGVVVLVGEDFEDLVKGRKQVSARQAGFICSPPGSE